MDTLIAASVDNWSHTEEWLLQKENELILNEAIEKLPSQKQLVFKLCKIERKSHEEVSKLLGISTSTVNNHLVKATQSLREYLSGRMDIAGLLLVAFLLK